MKTKINSKCPNSHVCAITGCPLCGLPLVDIVPHNGQPFKVCPDCVTVAVLNELL